MATAEQFRQIALALPGTEEAPHVDRRAFRVKRIFATLAADGRSANLMLTPEKQEFKCLLAPNLFAALDNGWGQRGATSVDITAASEDDLRAALAMAHAHAVAKKKG